MTLETRIAIGVSLGFHALLLAGLPAAIEPPAFDVERAPTSLELFLVSPASLQPSVQPEALPVPVERESLPQPQPSQPVDPAPQTVFSEERKGAVVDVAPGYLRNPPPRYPTLAQERGYQGTVVLEVEVLASGRCGAVNVLASSGHEVLDEAAARAVRRWVFRPARRSHHPVVFWVEVPVTFRLVNGTIPETGVY